MRDAKLLRLSLLGVLLLAIQLSPCHGLCSLVNETVAQCHDLEDAKFIDGYNLSTLKTSISQSRLHAGMFYNQSHLRHLELTHGELELIEPGAFRLFHELRSLDLSYNKIENLPPTVFDGLIKLRSLHVRKNALKQIPVAVMSLKNLKVFEIGGNPLNCDCQTLKMRDLLIARGVHLSKRTLCSSPANLKARELVTPDTQVICMLEDQDKEMQMDQPAVEGSGEIQGDPFDEATTVENLGEEHEMSDNIAVAAEESETQEPTKSPDEDDAIVPATETTATTTPTAPITDEPAKKTTRSEEATFISDESEKHVLTSPVPASATESAEDPEMTTKIDKESLLRSPDIPVEGSGEGDDPEGSIFEGSGTGVPPISWDISDDKTGEETASTSPDSENGWFGLIWDTIAGTSAPPEDETTKDLNLQEEEFISATERTSTRSSKSPVDEEPIIPVISTKSGEASGKIPVDVEFGRNLDESKSGQVKAEETAEATEMSPARQSQKGMGSYVVLAILLAVLGALIGFAAYKGEFCKKKRKRNDVEGGTELKDMSKSLLDSGNGNQPKIASNGNLENVPLVCTSPPNDSKIRLNEPGTLPDGLQMRYSAVPDVVDPVKPPRKSFLAHEEPERTLANGRSHQDLVNSSAPGPEACFRTKSPVQPALNGNRHDSVSSLGTDSRGSPRTSPPESIPTNGSLGNFQGLTLPPLSPGAQRVKITLQDNPDSVPRTPILITRTKAGENLVKTP